MTMKEEMKRKRRIILFRQNIHQRQRLHIQVVQNISITQPTDRRVLSSRESTHEENGRQPKEDLHHKIEKELCVEQLKPILMYFQILGWFPVRFSDSGQLKFNTFMLIYSIVMFSVIIYMVISSAQIRIRRLDSDEEFVVYMHHLLTALLPFFSFITPFMWMETSSLVRTLDHWTSYQVRFFQVTGHPLVLSLRPLTIFWMVVLTAFALSLNIFNPYLKFRDFRTWLPFLIGGLGVLLLPSFWCLRCQALRLAGIQLRRRLKEQLAKSGNKLVLVSAYRRLWNELNVLACETGDDVCSVNLYNFIFTLFVMSMVWYGTLVEIERGVNQTSILLLFIALFSFWELFGVCDVAHQATEEISSGLKEEIQVIKVETREMELWNEIRSFLQEIAANPTKINVGGYFVINRAHFASAISLLVTYLIFIIQFSETSRQLV